MFVAVSIVAAVLLTIFERSCERKIQECSKSKKFRNQFVTMR